MKKRSLHSQDMRQKATTISSSNANGAETDSNLPKSEPGPPSVSKATGPRTKSGKRRSSQNATKSGIFSRATLTENESREEYESLRAGLWKSKQPGNEFEEILLDKMVSNLWRQRRALISEVAEIRKNSEFLVFDGHQKKLQEADGISQKLHGDARFILQFVGLIWSIKNPEVLDRCLEILIDLQEGFEDSGFDDPQNERRLSTIYGHAGMPHLRQTLQDEYSGWLGTAKMSDEARGQGNYATPEECHQNVPKAIAAEIKRLEHYKEKHNSIESKRTEVEILRQGVPDSPALDRLLRYMNSLERAFDRMLTLYDRAQRMRKGQPLPPQLDVKIS